MSRQRNPAIRERARPGEAREMWVYSLLDKYFSRIGVECGTRAWGVACQWGIYGLQDVLTGSVAVFVARVINVGISAF